MTEKNSSFRRFWREPGDPLSIYDVAYVSESGGIDTLSFGHQPTTDDIILQRGPGERFAIQVVGGVCMVYDLKMVRVKMHRRGIASLPLPSFQHKDQDAAIAWAMLKASD
jgi:hypothetical protein